MITVLGSSEWRPTVRVSRRAVLVAATLSAASAGAEGVAGAEAEIRERHRALLRAMTDMDKKRARTFYTPDYRSHVGAGSLGLDETLKRLFSFLTSQAPCTIKSSLSDVKVTAMTAVTKEVAEITYTNPNGGKRTLPRQVNELTWKRVGGLWLISSERAIELGGKPVVGGSK